MLELRASPGDGLFANAMTAFSSPPDSPHDSLDLTQDDTSAVWDYASFLLEQQEGYCQLV